MKPTTIFKKANDKKKLSTKEALSKVPTTAEALTVEGSYVNSTRA